MASMASNSTGNPYEHYQEHEIEQDLIDPNDGELSTMLSFAVSELNSQQPESTISKIFHNQILTELH